MSLKQFARKNRDLVLKIVDAIVALHPGYGDTISWPAIAGTLSLDPNIRENRLAFHAARDECVELTPSLCFKVKSDGDDGDYVRLTEEERAKQALRYLRKSKTAAYRAIRRTVRTKLPENAPPDVKRDHERRLIQASNIYHDIKSGLRTSRNGKWFGMEEASPDPRPTVRPVPSPERPKGSRWMGLDEAKSDDEGEAPAQAPKK